MTINKSRRISFDQVKESPTTKRRRVMSEGDTVTCEGVVAAPTSSTLTCFDSLNSNCLVEIFSYLLTEEMNTLAICSKSCCKARANESLDQTRIGIIVCSESTTVHSISNAIVKGQWNNAFTGKRTHLRIENAASIHVGGGSHDQLYCFDEPDGLLERVLEIDISCHGQADQIINQHAIHALLQLVPNVKNIHLSGSKVRNHEIPNGGAPFRHHTNLTRLTWSNAHQSIFFDGFGILDPSGLLPELYVDECCFISIYDKKGTKAAYESAELPYTTLLGCGRGLRRVSIKNATWYSRNRPAESFPVSQEMLIKMVRNPHLRSLRWLRSDLTPENMAMLQRERPEVTFVSDQ